ncbi:MAG: hypothetical protein KUG77_24635 [Nannocystaceae bacterium]|nr:hypothetical protein [Nannocystaceae bacterium]
MRVWFPETEPSWRWTIDGDATLPIVEDADGGARFSFDLSASEPNPHTLALWDSQDEVALFGLELAPDRIQLDNFEFAHEVQAALQSTSPQVRGDAAKSLLADPSTTEAEELARAHYARILAYDDSDPNASAKAVLAALEREERLATAGGYWSVSCGTALIGAYFGTLGEKPELLLRPRLREAECRVWSTDLGNRFDHYLGKQALHEGAYADAEARLSRVLELSKRLHPEQSISVSESLMELFVRTGRLHEAQRELESLEALPLNLCQRAMAESSIGFIRIRARQSEGNLGDPRPGLLTALRAHAPGGDCSNVALHIHDLTKLGYDASLRGDTPGLRHYVEQLSQTRLDGKYRHQAAELELELAIAQRRFSEVPTLAEAMHRLTTQSEPEARWRLQMILAKAATAQGNSAAAQAAYVAAEGVLNELWTGVSSYAIRARWLDAYRRSALGLLRVRLDLGDLEGAACAARSARRRALQMRDDPNITKGSCEIDWARGEDELVFLIVPASADDWYVFVVVEERVVEASLVAAPTSGHDTRWWDPWTAALGSSRRVRILASGAALRAPLHQLGWQGEPLMQQRPVTFGLDLDTSQDQEGPTSLSASVVFADADPYRSLTRYAPDIREVHATLERGGWSAGWRETSGGSLPMADAIQPGGLLFYYGHGQRVSVTRSSPLSHDNDVGSTALLLAPDAQWGTQDVSSLDHAPRWAVLLGCDVAFPDDRSWSGGLNLAHALLLAGTNEVLAATGPLDAKMAAQVGARLFSGHASEAFELSDALHRLWATDPSPEALPPFSPLRVWSR